MRKRSLSWQCIKWLLLSDYATSLRKACDSAVEVGKKFGLIDTDLLFFELAVDEAVTNALESELTAALTHKGLPYKNVRLSDNFGLESLLLKPSSLISFWVKNDLLRVEVLDNGPGFVPSMYEESDLLKDRGRGCLILKNSVDLVLWKRRPRGGTRCILFKKIPTGVSKGLHIPHDN